MKHPAAGGATVAFVLALAFGGAPRGAAAWGLPERPADTWVVDAAGLLSASEATAIDLYGARVERERGVRLAVLTLSSLDGRDPKVVAVDTLNTWRAGRRSVLLLVSLSPRKLYL